MKKVQANRPSPSPRSLRALILEDNRQDVERMVALLKQVGYALSFEVVDSLAHLQQQLARTDYDIILAAHNLRAWTAMDALEILKKSRKDIPFVVVAGTLGGLAAVECIKQGAADYVLKNRLQRLPVVVERVLRDKAHREDAAGLQEQIQSLSRFPAENPNPVLRLQRDGTLIYANPSARPLLQLWGCEVGQRVPADWATLVADSIASGAGKEVEAACDQRVYSFILAPIQTAGYVNAYGRDITDRKREEEALRRSEASYRSLILGATYGIFRCDVNGKFLAVNPALVAMLGYESEADLLAANLVRDVIRDPEEGVRLLQQYRQRGRVDGIEAQWSRKDGTPVPVRLSGRAVLDERGALEGCEIIAEDASEHWHLEEQLRRAQKMEAVGRLAGGVAHDFNNLLTIVMGYSDLLLERLGATDAMRAYVEEIKKAGERAASLTRQLLAFGRRQVLAPQTLDLNTVVTNVDKMLRRLIGENIQLGTVLEPELGWVKADPGQIEQVILNLALNARDAMPQGGQLTLETANVELNQGDTRTRVSVLPGRYVMLAVSDSGVGMDAETQAHIFEPFFTTKEEGKGTGLGLATVYGIVKQSGGHIWLYSEPNHGTSFKIYLPRLAEAAQPVEAISPGAPLAGGSETILLVEDEEGVRDLARRILELKGYKVITASNPTEAAQVCERYEGPIHLLLTDVVMPTMSGPQLAEHVAFLRPGLKVLYISGYTDNAIVPHGILEEGVQFLQKPFTRDSLTRKVREVLEAPQPTA